MARAEMPKRTRTTSRPNSSTAPTRSRSSRASRVADIEDAVPDVEAPASPSSRKRKRATPAAGKVKTEEDDDDDDDDAGVKTRKKTPRKASAAKQPSTTDTPTTKAPPNWSEIYAAVQAMRSPGGAASNAPVDTMGCERLALATASAVDQRFHTLVALMLSSQTKDTVNAIAMRRLQTELEASTPDVAAGLTVSNVIGAPPARLNELIRVVGFHNNKTRYLQQAATICRDSYGGDIPSTFQGLTALPGVGPKMAHLCLSAAWGRTEGIGVDVHVHRITNLWGWHGGSGGKSGGSKNPEDTRARLESWLPREKWREINALLVGLGQTVCAPLRPQCGRCEVGLKGLCRSADRKKVLEGRREREGKEEAKEEGKEEVKEEGKEEGKEEEMVKKEEEKKMEEQVVKKEVVVKREEEEEEVEVKVERRSLRKRVKTT